MEDLLLKYKSLNIKAVLCITKLKHFAIKMDAILSKFEIDKYESLKTETGRQEFLLGRYSAKKAYAQLNQQDNLKNIEIKNGIFEQPFFAYNSDFDVSISHTKGAAGAIVFDKAYPMGFDMELICNSKISALQAATKDEEIMRLNVSHEKSLTMAWCLKEALSKAIRTGFTIPLELLQIEDFVKISDKDVFTCRFKNFAQYKGIAKINGDYVVALSYPQQLTARV